MTEVVYTEQALDQLDDLEPDVADRILNKVDEAAEWPDHRLAPLRGFPYHKLRIGDYRAIIEEQGGNPPLQGWEEADMSSTKPTDAGRPTPQY